MLKSLHTNVLLAGYNQSNLRLLQRSISVQVDLKAKKQQGSLGPHCEGERLKRKNFTLLQQKTREGQCLTSL